MYLSRSEYDRGVNTFSPAGRLFQVEYAIKAIKLGSTALGIQTAEGVVLAVEKRIESKLMLPASIKKIVQIDEHIGCAMSGLVADAHQLIDHARVETQNHWFTYDELMTTEGCVRGVSDLALGFGEGKMARPFGVALLMGGVDEGQPVLYHCDPTGSYTKYEAKAIGAAAEGAQATLQERYHTAMSLAEAKKLAMEVLKNVMEEKINSENVELAVLDAESGRYLVADKQELQALVDSLEPDVI